MQHDAAATLSEFIHFSKSKGASDEFLISFLTRRGWSQEDIYAALASYWEQVTGVTIPDRTGRSEPAQDAFLYLLAFSTLATWSSALGFLVFSLINRWFPDPVMRSYLVNARHAMTWQMASIVVAFPIFLIVMRAIVVQIRVHPESLQSGVRKWVTYIALLLTAGGIICDLIWFFDYFLTGELTIRFVLKSLTAMVICAAIFTYYLGSLRWKQNTEFAQVKRFSLTFGTGAATVVIGSFCMGLAANGSPSAQRHLEADQQRVQDLRGISYAIYNWHQRTKRDKSTPPLPPTLPALAARGGIASRTVDPETRTPYEYHPQDGSRYELCATFSGTAEADAVPPTLFWQHGEGRNCFMLDASRPPAWQ